MYFTEKNLMPFAQKCESFLNSNEIGVYLFPVRSNKGIRIDQLIEHKMISMPSVRLNFLPEEFEKMYDDPENIIKSKIPANMTGDIGIFVSNGELLFHRREFHVADIFLQLQRRIPRFHFILFFDVDITHPELARNFSEPELFNNIAYYPLCSYEESLRFIEFQCETWQMQLKSSIKERVARECCGRLWLLKPPLRMLRSNPEMSLDEIFSSDQMTFRLEQLVYNMLDSERKVMYRLLKAERITDEIERHSYLYLKTLGIINDSDEITIPLLSKFLRTHMPQIQIEISEKQLLLNNINVEAHFSKKEKRILKVLLEQKNKIVTREEIAKAIWPIDTESEYSDWAVDRLMARLRAKLKELGMPKETVKTYRNKGYMLVG
jgi:hypothetical protein